LSFPLFAQSLSTRAPQPILVITVIVCVLWAAVPQAQELITSVIVLNAIWLAQIGARNSTLSPSAVQQ
jgi:hypothetical protein